MNKVKELRLSKEWSQKRLADEAKVAQSLISYIERGSVVNSGIETLSKIAVALGVSVQELCEAKTPTGTCG